MATIHLIDDSATMLMSMEMLLKRAGYDVIKSPDGPSALDTLASASPKLIITDLTTESQQTRRDEAKQAGATGWLVKPVEPEQLLGIVKQLVPAA